MPKITAVFRFTKAKNVMKDFMEIRQPMPDNTIQISTGDGNKKLEIFAGYEDKKRFSIVLTNREASRLASRLKSSSLLSDWIRLENEQILRVLTNGEVRQVIVSDVKNGKEIIARKNRYYFRGSFEESE